MATEALKSGPITNRDATPPVLNNSSADKNRLVEATGHVTTTSSVTSGSTYTMVTVPSNARISQILVSCAAMAGSSAADLGVYRNTADGGAVVDADFFATAIDLSSALTNSDVTNESATYTVAKQQQPLWQALGVSADPNTTYDIVFTTTATINTGAALGIKVRYCV